MKIIDSKISLVELQNFAENSFGDFVKAVVDVKRNIMAIDAELHSDEESLLLENGSEQKDLWGINIYPFESGGKLIEFDSMINIRPRQGNRSRDIKDNEIRKWIRAIVGDLISNG